MFSYFYLKRIETGITTSMARMNRSLSSRSEGAGSGNWPEEYTVHRLRRLCIGEDTGKSAASYLERPPPLNLYTSHLHNKPAKDIISSRKEPFREFYRAVRQQWRKGQLQAQHGSLFDTFPEAFTLYGANDVDLSLMWRVPMIKRSGNHHVIGMNLGTMDVASGSRLLGVTPAPLGQGGEGSGLGQGQHHGQGGGGKRGSAVAGVSTGVTVKGNGGARRKSTLLTLYNLPPREPTDEGKRGTGVMSGGASGGAGGGEAFDDPSNPTSLEQYPAKVLLTSASELVHDFSMEGLAFLPVTLAVKNAGASTIRFTLELTEPEESSVPMPHTARMTQSRPTIPRTCPSAFRFDWSGWTKLQGELGPGEEDELRAKASFSRPGIYNLNRWCLTVVQVLDGVEGMDEEGEEVGGEGGGEEDGREGSIASGVSHTTAGLGGKGRASGSSAMGLQTPNLPHLITVYGEWDD
ncbi:hypothetical protein BJ684DRAFT_22175 [Piptocephalis cylindrospora]|uniref:TPPC8 C-terminal Ig-like domain-containing protein n=1 Tax=Piptocephalis cylindrospora TaxID=1907219 RepID=A0A4P9XXZ1_9FUNG|nr:hypothetical protein BJ684DRAFT_22175 [Piptocephalis cylindrospora]|eukprot:RKP11275.1 hypothetical protein BJ684DRAFT_22175 [Piptocephalis cylindrospora]